MPKELYADFYMSPKGSQNHAWMHQQGHTLDIFGRPEGALGCLLGPLGMPWGCLWLLSVPRGSFLEKSGKFKISSAEGKFKKIAPNGV